MRQRSTRAADRRAAQAALARPHSFPCDEFDPILLIDDTDNDVTDIHNVLRERSPRALEVLS